MKKQWISVLLAVALVCTLAACAGKGEGSSNPDEQADFPVTVRDADIADAPEKIVSLSPGTTEMLFAMGYGSRVTGVSEYCDTPREEVAKRQKCGSAMQPQLRIITSLAPDLVVTAAPLQESDLIQLQQADIPVLVLPYADSLEGLQKNYLDLACAVQGKVTGAAAGDSFWQEMEALLSEAKALSADSTPLTAILLREMSYGMATGDTFEGQLLEEIGFVNDAKRFSNWLDDKEEVAALEPDVIFADNSITESEIKDSSVYKPVQAVLNDRILNVDLAAFERQSPRMFETLLQMAEFAYGGEAADDQGDASGSTAGD